LDGFSAQAALSSGEIDWWESPSRDVADLVACDRNVTLISHYQPAMGILRFNQLYRHRQLGICRLTESAMG
jgi:hypothetical protein